MPGYVTYMDNGHFREYIDRLIVERKQLVERVKLGDSTAPEALFIFDEQYTKWG